MLREQEAARGDSRARGFEAPISRIALNPGHGQKNYGTNRQTGSVLESGPPTKNAQIRCKRQCSNVVFNSVDTQTDRQTNKHRGPGIDFLQK